MIILIIMIGVTFIRTIFRRHEEWGGEEGEGVKGQAQDAYIDDDVDDEVDDDNERLVESKVDGMTEYKKKKRKQNK